MAIRNNTDRSKWNKTYISILVVVWLSVLTGVMVISRSLAVFHIPSPMKPPEECYRDNLGPTQADDLAKIDSYRFDGIEKYSKDLFQPINKPSEEQKEMQTIPTFVSGFSSNHFQEGMVMIDAFNETIRARYPDAKMIIFDLGLSKKNIKKIERKWQYEIRKFHFQKYSKHVKTLSNFAWKAIAIQIVANEYPFIVWMDTSIRFTTNNLDTLFQQVQKHGLLVRYAGKTNGLHIARSTHFKTFQFLNEQSCTYALHAEPWATIIMLYANSFIRKYFLYPFVACALTLGCMEPEVDGSDKYRSCDYLSTPEIYHYCHRADQSVLGILFHRLFHAEPEKHKLDTKYFDICRAPKRHCNKS